jgi:hypothetical protein
VTTCPSLHPHPAPPAPGSHYAALGSSFAAGPGIRPLEHTGALRSRRNYPHLVAERLGLRLTDATSSGSTTEHVLRTPQRLLREQAPPQIGAVTDATALVTVTSGGNDLGYMTALNRASFARGVLRRVPVLPAATRRRLEAAVDLTAPAGAADRVVAGLVEVVERVRERAPGARVLLVDYLPVLEPGARRAFRMPLLPSDVAEAVALAAVLDGVFARAAAEGGAELVRASAAGAGHGLGSADPWVTDHRWRNPYLGGRIPYHPTARGMAAVADLVVRQVAGGDGTGR